MKTTFRVSMILAATTAAVAFGQDEGLIICKPTTGRLASMTPSPNGDHIVCISHNNDDLAMPFHVSVDGRMVTKVKLLAPARIYWSRDSQAFGWWKWRDNGWIPVVTTVDGKEIFSGAESYKTLALGGSGWHNMSSTFESGPTKITYYFDDGGMQYIGGKPNKGDTAGVFLALSDNGRQVGRFVGTYGTNKVVSWRYQGVRKPPSENYDYVWLPSLVLLQKQEAAFSIQRQGKCFIVCGSKEYGPYESNSRIYVDRDGSKVAWFGQEGGKWSLFVNGSRKAGPFEDIDSAQFLQSGDLAYVAKREGKLLAVGTNQEWVLADDNFIAGPCFSPDGKHVGCATAQRQHPWDAEIAVDGKKVFGPFSATTYREGDYTKLDQHGVLSVSWRAGNKEENILRALVLKDGNVVRLAESMQ